MPKQIRRSVSRSNRKRTRGQRFTQSAFETLSRAMDRINPSRNKAPKRPARTGVAGQRATDPAVREQNRRPGLRIR